ncbi:MAG TPA: GntR family transcriptional regulator [Sediminispirochaeta sp.]|nr:GntR family transcriptional regulator [Sediminispirochaeta sp.]
MQFDPGKAIYAQIAERIVDNILSEKWPEEERIPAVRELAVSLEVNPNTVVRAYNYLQEQELIYNQRGIGYFVAPDGRARAKDMKRREFLDKELPYFFKNLVLLDIDMKEIERRFEEFKQGGGNNEN